MGARLVLRVPLKIKSEKVLEKFIQREADRLFDIVYEPSVKVARDTVQQHFKSVYDRMIDQYYEYVTVSYYRHVVGKGTGTGNNLYRPFEAAFRGSYDESRYFYYLSPDRLESYLNPYQKKNIKEISETRKQKKQTPLPQKEAIYSYIMNGGRTMLNDPQGTRPHSWRPNFTDEYFGTIKGIPRNAIKQAEKKIPKVFQDVFIKEVVNRLSSLRVKWVY